MRNGLLALTFLLLARAVWATPVGPLSVALAAGWNPVAFQAAQLTSLNSNPAVAGVAFWDGATYQLRNLTTSELNASGGGRRGYWVFATSATTFTYTATDDSQGELVNLSSGYNLVSFASSANFPAANLSASVSGQSVPLGQVVLPTFYEIGADGTYTAVDASTGTIRAGRAYWVYASGAVSLRYSLSPAPSPLPSIASRTVQITQLSPYQANGLNFTANTTLDLTMTIAPSTSLVASGNYSASATGAPGLPVACEAAGPLGPGSNNFTTVTGTLNIFTRNGTMTVLGAYPATVTLGPGLGPALVTSLLVNATFAVKLEADNSVTVVLPPLTAPANSTTGVAPTNFKP